MPPRKPPPTETARVLRRLRDDAGLSAKDAGARAGLNQSAVSHFETGRVVPSGKQLDALCRVYDASDDDRGWLYAHSREVDTEYRRVAAYKPQAARLQREYGELEAASTRVVTFTPTVVPGLLQTSAYMAAMAGESLNAAQYTDWEAARRARSARLREPGRAFEQIVYEGALRYGLGGPTVMLSQIERLIEISRMPQVELGVIPFVDDAGGTHFTNGFDLYEQDGRAARVIVGTLGSVLIHHDPEDVALYVAQLDRLRRLAVWGEPARTELDRIACRYRG